MSHISVKISFATTQFPEFSFSGPHAKPHGVGGLSKHYHLRLDPKLVRVKYAILIIPCTCISCTTMLDNTWACKFYPNKQPCYQPVFDCTYWPVWALSITGTSLDLPIKQHQVNILTQYIS